MDYKWWVSLVEEIASSEGTFLQLSYLRLYKPNAPSKKSVPTLVDLRR